MAGSGLFRLFWWSIGSSFGTSYPPAAGGIFERFQRDILSHYWLPSSICINNAGDGYRLLVLGLCL